MSQDLIYPIYPGSPGLIERLALKSGFSLGFCPVCGRPTIMLRWGSNFRETGICVVCRSTNRQRQMAYMLCRSLAAWKGYRVASLPSLRKNDALAIYNTEASGSLHRQLETMKGYSCSEYYGPNHAPGATVNGVRHEDLARLSFADRSFDFVLSSDVFEHVPRPYVAHREVFRVLKDGGRHIFTVPFHQTQYFDEILVEMEGDKPKFLKPPIYHLDPLSPDGILLHTIFSLELLLKLREIGFRTHMYRLYNPWLGILGPNGIVFEAIKGE